MAQSLKFGIAVPVLKLYGISHAVNTMVECQDETNSSVFGSSHQDMIEKARNLHRHMRQKKYTQVVPVTGQRFTDDVDAFFGENGGELKGERFTLQIQSQNEWGKNRHHVRVREQDPKQYLKLFNNVDITPLHESMLIPIYDVEIKARNPDTVVGGMNLLVPVEANKELGTDFIVFEQDKTSSSWNDITEKCKMDKCLFTESTVISIPIEKSSKVWVVRVKKSLHSLLHVLLVLLLGNVHFRILGFFRVRNKDICLRIIGITENLYQNPKRLRTEVEIAEEGGFQKVEESDAKLLLRRGKLLVSFYLAGNCQNSTHFDLGGTSTSKVAQRHDFKFSVGDLKRIPKVEIRTANDAEEVLWSIDLRNLIKIQECAELSANITRPEFDSLDEEVQNGDIPWLAHEVNKDWEKLAVCLNIGTADIRIIKENNTKRDVEHRCSTMLQLWSKIERRARGKASWRTLQQALEHPEVGRSDIFRHLLMEDEISDRVLLKVSHEVGSSWRKFGSCLNIPWNEIDIIDANETTVEEKCMALLRKWREGKYASMNELVQALRDPVMQLMDIANDLMSRRTSPRRNTVQ